MKSNLTVQSLDYEEIKYNLIEFLKTQSKFSDYDFTASGLDVITSELAYHAHYGGLYTHFLAGESFIDSVRLKSSLYSKSKLVNYIPRSKMAAVAEVEIYVNNLTDDAIDNKILLKRGNIATASKSISQLTNDNRNFIIIDDLYIYNKSVRTGEYDYHSDKVEIYEGQFIEDKYLVDNTIINQRFNIISKSVDYRTIRVKVYPTETDLTTDNFNIFRLASDFMNIDSTSNIFFLTVNEDENYELHFGNGVYGQALNHNNVIEISYVESNGEIGNDAKYFFHNGNIPAGLTGNNINITLTTISMSDGGREAETLEELRFNIPHHNRRQNRVVKEFDYKTILLEKYENISSINVWGGEDNYPKVYGSVFISIKPKFGNVLSSKAKDKVKSLLKLYNVITTNPIIVDADFIYINLENNTKYNPLLTNDNQGEIQSKIQSIIDKYNAENVSKFEGYYSDGKLTSLILENDKSIISTYNNIQLEKRIIPILTVPQTHIINFTNSIKNVRSSEFTYNGKLSYFYDADELIYIKYYDDITEAWKSLIQPFGTVDYVAGIIKLNDIRIDSIKNSDYISFMVIPIKPDFYSLNNNILQINKVNYNVNI